MPFEFKSRSAKLTSYLSTTTTVPTTSTAKNTPISDPSNLCKNESVETIKNLSCEKRVIQELQNYSFILQNISNCVLLFPFKTKAIHLRNVTNSTIVFYPIETSILMRDCAKLSLVAAAQQIRVHNSTDLEMYVYSSTAVVIEKCKDIYLAPYRLKEFRNLSSTSLETDKYSKYEAAWNQCTTIRDFECVVGKSPNWHCMEKTKWREFSGQNLEDF